MSICCKYGYIDAIKILFSFVDKSQSNYIENASINGFIEVVVFLIKEVFSFDECSLSVAISNGHLDIVKHLVENGLKVNGIDPYSYDELTFLGLAEEKCYTDIIDFINCNL